jgi:hypothetical protein
MSRRTYLYSIVRYVPDIASEEFINSGIILVAVDGMHVAVGLTNNTRRALDFLGADNETSFYTLWRASAERYLNYFKEEHSGGSPLRFLDRLHRRSTNESLQYSGIRALIGHKDTIEEELEHLLVLYTGHRPGGIDKEP